MIDQEESTEFKIQAQIKSSLNSAPIKKTTFNNIMAKSKRLIIT